MFLLPIWWLVRWFGGPSVYDATYKTETVFTDDEIARAETADLSPLSHWELVCEEIVDTEYPPVYYRRCKAELLRRGKTEQEFTQMRKFAWETAGWLNYYCMMWDWVSIGDKDIELAIDMQWEDGKISAPKRDEMLTFFRLHQ